METTQGLTCKAVLMVEPDFYRVEYAINPHMVDENGKLKKVDMTRAQAQWKKLVETYQKIGLTVYTIRGRADLPDMVFSANNSFPFIHPKKGVPTVLMGRMKSPLRQPEIPIFEKWFRENGYTVKHLKNQMIPFEGNGDALLHPIKTPAGKTLVWGGYGHRTDVRAYDELTARYGFEVITLKLVMPEFYHLDTCFAILNEETVVLQAEAFMADDVQLIKKKFRNVIETELHENMRTFACNCFSPDGKAVIIQKGAEKVSEKLFDLGFHVHPVETGEFLKGGGSVFCLKMALPKA